MPHDPKYHCVYIMGSLLGTLYIGVSGNLHRGVFQHKFHHFEGFSDRYDVTRLLFGNHTTMSTKRSPARNS